MREGAVVDDGERTLFPVRRSLPAKQPSIGDVHHHVDLLAVDPPRDEGVGPVIGDGDDGIGEARRQSLLELHEPDERMARPRSDP